MCKNNKHTLSSSGSWLLFNSALREANNHLPIGTLLSAHRDQDHQTVFAQEFETDLPKSLILMWSSKAASSACLNNLRTSISDLVLASYHQTQPARNPIGAQHQELCYEAVLLRQHSGIALCHAAPHVACSFSLYMQHHLPLYTLACFLCDGTPKRFTSSPSISCYLVAARE